MNPCLVLACCAVVAFLEPFLLFCFVLGLLSSIGLGTGVPTHAMFLLPVTFSVMTSTECGDLRFQVAVTDWVVCHAFGKTPEAELLASLGPVYLAWFLGSAFGEIPVFLLMRKRSYRVGKWMKWTVDKIGFPGVVLCAAWPSMLCDMSGVACGQAGMSLPKFTAALVIGKVGIRALCEYFLWTSIFSNHARGKLFAGIKAALDSIDQECVRYQQDWTLEPKVSWPRFVFHLAGILTFLWFCIGTMYSFRKVKTDAKTLFDDVIVELSQEHKKQT